MSVWRRLGRLLQVLSAALAVPLQVALADPLSHITPEAAYAEIARGAELRSVQIDGDFDVAKMQPPPGAKRFVMRDVQLDGTLLSSAAGPALPFWIDRSHLRNVDLRGISWSAALEIENSVVDRSRLVRRRPVRWRVHAARQ